MTEIKEKLFDYFLHNYGIALIDSEMNEIIDIAQSEYKKALRQIEQMSDCGSDYLAVVRMKGIASITLEKL